MSNESFVIVTIVLLSLPIVLLFILCLLTVFFAVFRRYRMRRKSRARRIVVTNVYQMTSRASIQAKEEQINSYLQQHFSEKLETNAVHPVGQNFNYACA